MCSSGHDEEVAFKEEWLEGSLAEHGGAMSEVVEAASMRGVPCLTLCTVYKEEPCCAAVAVRAEGCADDAVVDRVAARIEDEVVVDDAVWHARRREVAVEGNAAGIEDDIVVDNAVWRTQGEAAPVAAEPAAARVVYKAVDAEASCVGFRVGTIVAKGVGEVVRGLAMFRLMAPAAIVALAAAIRATGVLRTRGREAAVEGGAAGIEGMVAVVAGGHGVAGIEGAAETGAAGVMHKPTVVAVVAEAAAVVCEGVAAKTTGDNAVAAESITSGIVNDVAVAKAVGRTISKRTSDAASAVAIVVHRSAFDIVVVPFATRTTRAVAVAATAVDTTGVGATGVTACNVTADADLASVVSVVIIVAVAVADAVGGTVIEG
jgi:hypothetical protein